MILRIANIERIKTLYSPVFRTITLLHTILFIMVVLVGASFRLNIQGIAVEKIFHFPHIWNTLAWIASWFNLLLGILAIMLVTNEFQFRTFRKQLIDGLTRNELLAGKVIVFISMALYTMLLVFATGIVLGSTKSPEFNMSDFINGLPYLPILFLQSLSYMLLAMLFAFLIRNTALAIVAFILYFFPIEPIIRAFLPDILIKFMPVKLIANLTPMPDFVGISLGDSIQVLSSSPTEVQPVGFTGAQMPLIAASAIAAGYCMFFILTSKMVIDKKNF